MKQRTSTEMPLFEMEYTHQIMQMDLETAKKFLVDKIESRKDMVKDKSYIKGMNMVNNAKSVEKLMFGVSNFILAFQGSCLKCIKPKSYYSNKRKYSNDEPSKH